MGDEAEIDAEKVFGAKLRDLRQQRGWTQQDLAQRLKDQGLALHQSAIARIEAGGRPVRVNEAVLVARVFDADLSTLLPRLGRSTKRDIEELERGLREAEAREMEARKAADIASIEVSRLAEALDVAEHRRSEALTHLGMVAADKHALIWELEAAMRERSQGEG